MPLSIFDMIDSVTSRLLTVRCGKFRPVVFDTAGRFQRVAQGGLKREGSRRHTITRGVMRMPAVFIVLLILDVATLAASQCRGSYGYAWANQTCSMVYGMCDEPLLLGVAGAAIVGTIILAAFHRV